MASWWRSSWVRVYLGCDACGCSCCSLVLFFVFEVFVVFMWGVFMQFVLIFVLFVWLCSLRPVSLFVVFFLHFINKIKPLPGILTTPPSSEPPGVLVSVSVCSIVGCLKRCVNPTDGSASMPTDRCSNTVFPQFNWIRPQSLCLAKALQCSACLIPAHRHDLCCISGAVSPCGDFCERR